MHYILCISSLNQVFFDKIAYSNYSIIRIQTIWTLKLVFVLVLVCVLQN